MEPAPPSFKMPFRRRLHFGGDDVTVTHTKGNVIQSNEYYPYGLQTAASWTRESNTGNNFLYNGGTELNQTTQVYDLYYRSYDPALGRFGQVDPMASRFGSVNPYNYGFNNPAAFNDPLGDCPTCNHDYDVRNGPHDTSDPNRVYQDRLDGRRLLADHLERMTMAQDAQAVRDGRMSHDEYFGRYGAMDGGFSIINRSHWQSDARTRGSISKFQKATSDPDADYTANQVNILGTRDIWIEEWEVVTQGSEPGDPSGWGLTFYSGVPIVSSPWVEIPPKVTTSFRGKLTTKSYFEN